MRTSTCGWSTIDVKAGSSAGFSYLGGSGLLLWNRRGVVIAALYGQLLMLVLFVVILVSSVPEILVMDAAFFAAAIYLLYRYHTSPGAGAAAPTGPSREAR